MLLSLCDFVAINDKLFICQPARKLSNLAGCWCSASYILNVKLFARNVGLNHNNVNISKKCDGSALQCLKAVSKQVVSKKAVFWVCEPSFMSAGGIPCEHLVVLQGCLVHTLMHDLAYAVSYLACLTWTPGTPNARWK